MVNSDHSSSEVVCDTVNSANWPFGPRRPIKPLPVDGMKPLKTTQDNRVNPQVILIDIALRQRRIIGAEPVLFAIRTDPMINDMIDT